jgi:hypothetical protein
VVRMSGVKDNGSSPNEKSQHCQSSERYILHVRVDSGAADGVLVTGDDVGAVVQRIW